jgi:glycosyltransferase involved in cell wall biosynthesis
MEKEMKKILFVVNTPEFFLSHRLPLAIAASKAGFDVHVASAYSAGVDVFNRLGFEHHVIDIVRSGQNPFKELLAIIQILWILKKIHPQVVHLVTIKPVLYGGLAVRLARVDTVVAAVSGLGTVFLSHSGFAGLRKKFISFLYCQAFKQKHLRVIFQNADDRQVLLDIGALSLDQSRLIRGSGVDLHDYPFVCEPDGTPVVVMAARLLRDKGVYEYVEAVRLLRQRGVNAYFRLIGALDTGNLSSIGQDQLDAWATEGVVELLGYRSDIAEQYAAANIVCLPSYREGLPKSLVEAAACGRAVVTTNVPGCRDAIEPDITGLLVPVKNGEALADALQRLIESPALRQSMGAAGRVLAEREFAIKKIVDAHLSIYQELVSPKGRIH